MYFRSQKKLQNEVSLSDSIDSDRDGDALQLLDVVGVDDTMLEDLYDRDSALRLRSLVKTCLSAREAEIIRLRYGLGGALPLTQREVASAFGISRSYVSRRHKCKRCPESLAAQGFPEQRFLRSHTALIVNGIKFAKTGGHSSNDPCRKRNFIGIIWPKTASCPTDWSKQDAVFIAFQRACFSITVQPTRTAADRFRNSGRIPLSCRR